MGTQAIQRWPFPAFHHAKTPRYLAASFLLLFLLASLRPSTVAEDGMVEGLTAFLFLLTAVLAASATFRNFGRGQWRALVSMGSLAAFALVLMLSEISFGARLLSFSMPAMEGGGEFDGGHDIVIWLLRRIEKWEPNARLAVTLALFLSAATMIAAAWHYRAQLNQVAQRWLDRNSRLRLAAALTLLALAVAIDLLSGPIAGTIEELFELHAAMLMVLAIWPQSDRLLD
jgi:hypothetical protein